MTLIILRPHPQTMQPHWEIRSLVMLLCLWATITYYHPYEGPVHRDSTLLLYTIEMGLRFWSGCLQHTIDMAAPRHLWSQHVHFLACGGVIDVCSAGDTTGGVCLKLQVGSVWNLVNGEMESGDPRGWPFPGENLHQMDHNMLDMFASTSVW